MGGIRLYVLLVLAVLLSGLAAMLPLAVTGSDALESSYREYAIRDMTANANLFALALAGDTGDKREIVRTASAGSKTRFTLIARDGTVIADSEEEAGRMENHANRPEIREALAGKTGVDIRPSPTLGTEWIYVAIPLPDKGVVRASTRLDELNGRLQLWWKRALIGFGASVTVLLALAFFVARALARPLEVAAAGADRYAKGDFSYRPPASGSAEMRKLSRSLGDMAGELDSRFRLINRQREEMRAVFENMSEGILAVDNDSRIMLLNRAAERLLHLREGLAGTAIENVARHADLLDVIRETADAEESLEREIRVAPDSGAETLVLIHSARIRENDRKIGVLVVLRDVTRLRQLEVMRRDFVANVSHELRTPITTIQSCLETLIEDGGGTPGETAGFLEMALKNTRRMGAIISNLLLLAGMESDNETDDGNTAGDVSAHPVRPVLDEALSLCREDAEARKATFDAHCEDALAAKMNPQLVVHALVNLLDNAVKYGPEGGVIGIWAGRRGDRVAIAVSDRGLGIAARHQPRVFERFYRIDGATRIKKGSGLGLALVKHIAQAQGGDITLESEIGSGSTFTLLLPGA